MKSSADQSEGKVNVGRYVEHLPSIFREHGTGSFLARFLLAFEHILSGFGDFKLGEEGAPEHNPEAGLVAGLEEILHGARGSNGVRLTGIHRYFDPGPGNMPGDRAPGEFLDWLGGWVALSFRAGLDESQWRNFIDRAADLYQKRGTKSSLLQLINIYTGQVATINEASLAFQVGSSALEADEETDEVKRGTWSTSRIDGLPHFFVVSAQLSDGDLATQAEHRKVIERIIEMEKPAHTVAALDITGTISMKIGDLSAHPEDFKDVHATVGKDTIVISRTSAE